jgi:very-short-patch-repair endonuclease
MSSDQLSTSALAKQGEISVQQLFSVLKDYGWIRKIDDGWVLTSKGEFEGGSYLTSKRYGRYIVWPPNLLEHQLFKAMESNKLLSATALGRVEGLSGRQLNRLFVELGWLQASLRGWELTAAGSSLGGQVFESQQSSLSYVMWPEDIRGREAYIRLLRQCRLDEQASDDLFEGKVSGWVALDGVACKNREHCYIAQWLYLAGIRYHIYRSLPVDELQVSDFYLPGSAVCLEYWGANEHSDAISARMRRAEIYKQLGLAVLDVHPEDIATLDDYLSRHLQQLGVDFY